MEFQGNGNWIRENITIKLCERNIAVLIKKKKKISLKH